MAAKALKANRLSDGEAVWLSRTGIWETRVTLARVEEDADGIAALEDAARTATADCIVVDAELIDMEIRDGAPVPSKLKERIRALGPTVRLDLGKQAEPESRLGKVA
ncbi:DUF2849 domain-containing protein [Rhodospirillaceae bacterium KN72]|uniref:DUF2849 domain-containing protein n=1 Tax=Pacificispira spongiicola TaxID=2729598 RepID=A0A7Y0HF15_9PROT|nr:DUF2849 domain-containing protein [Pacificispira spongiicola]NMM43507.1 DUF2849 domain-containing protein [Pacificispira spongiicola]